MATSTPIKTQVVCIGNIPDITGSDPVHSLEACKLESYQTPWAKLFNLISDEGYALFDSLSAQFSKDSVGALVITGIGGWYDPAETRSFRFRTDRAGKFTLKMVSPSGAPELDVSGQMTDVNISY